MACLGVTPIPPQQGARAPVAVSGKGVVNCITLPHLFPLTIHPPPILCPMGDLQGIAVAYWVLLAQPPPPRMVGGFRGCFACRHVGRARGLSFDVLAFP